MNVIFEDYVSTYIPTKTDKTESDHIKQIRFHISSLLSKGISFRIKLRDKIICTNRDTIVLDNDRFKVNLNSFSYVGIFIEII